MLYEHWSFSRWNCQSAKPRETDLRAVVNAILYMAVSSLDGLQTVGVAHAPSPVHKMGFLLKPSTRMPAYVMTSDRVLLAAKSDDEATSMLRKMDRQPFTKATLTSIGPLMQAIRKVQEVGFAAIEEELEVGLLSLAVAIRNRRGDTVASLNVSSDTPTTTLTEFCDAALPVMRMTAREIGAILFQEADQRPPNEVCELRPLISLSIS